MAVLTIVNTQHVYPSLFVLLEQALHHGASGSNSSQSVTYTYVDAVLVVEGREFGFDESGSLATGTIESFSYSIESGSTIGKTEFTLEDLNIAVTTALDLVYNWPTDHFESLFLFTPMEIIGHSGQDTNYHSIGRVWTPFNGDVQGRFYGGTDVFKSAGGNDRLFGGKGNDKLVTGHGNDKLFGQIGNDWLQGEDGNDVLKGGKGNDVIWGGSGRDRLIGGEGADVFLFHQRSNRDKVVDFELGIDVIYFALPKAPKIYDTIDGARMDFKGGSVLFIDIKAEELTTDHFTRDFPYFEG